MRSFLCICLCAVALPVLAYNEIVPAISYNPSRLGSYTHLKAVATATLGGGLKVVGDGDERPTINIFKQVTLQDTKHSANSPFNANNVNKIATIGDLEGTIVTKQSGGVLQGRNGTLYAANGYSGGGYSNNSGLTVIVKSGGTLRTTNTNSNNYSYIGEFEDINNPSSQVPLDITTNILELYNNNTITVTTNAANFTIGGITINKPSGTVSRYKFVERVDNAGTRYKVLSAEY